MSAPFIDTRVVACTLALFAAPLVVGCSSKASASADADATETTCAATQTCGEGTPAPVTPPGSSSGDAPGGDGGTPAATPSPTNGVKDGTETDVDCGGAEAPKCAEGKSCAADADCEVACSYAKKCVGAPSCATHLGGDTCGEGELEETGARHETCCRSLPVAGFTDPAHPGKTVYLDKYEVTAGRIRAWIERIAAENGGNPNVKAWVTAHRPAIWDPAWDVFLPTDWDGGTTIISRRLLGDPRPEDEGSTAPPGPGVVLPPATDQERHLGVNYQFNSEVYVDLHGGACGVHKDTYGYPTFWYAPEILARDHQLPRADGIGANGQPIPAKDHLDVKAMNCITNAMLAAFCAWDGGQLATTEVLDHVTATPATLGNISGCGTQYDNHGELLGNKFDHTVQTGGRCAPVNLVNATFDGGDALPIAGSPLNMHNYHYPNLGAVTHDKSWEVAAPGRGSLAEAAQRKQTDVVRLSPADEPWVDLNGNLNEAALETTGAAFTGRFALRYRGIAYGSSRSDLNMTLMKGETVLRIQRPEAKAPYTGGRCMRFR